MAKSKRVVVSSLAGLAGMFLLWSVGFVLVPNVTFVAFLFPGILLLLALGAAVPNEAVYSLFPEGGLDAAAGFSALFALLFWWFVGSVIAYLVIHKGGDRAKHISP